MNENGGIVGTLAHTRTRTHTQSDGSAACRVMCYVRKTHFAAIRLSRTVAQLRSISNSISETQTAILNLILFFTVILLFAIYISILFMNITCNYVIDDQTTLHLLIKMIFL